MGVTRTEALRYIFAGEQLKKIKKEYERKRYLTYDQIHPTRTAIIYETGEIIVESTDPVEYAMYLCELKNEYEEAKEEYEQRVIAFQKVEQYLSKDEKNNLYGLDTISKIQKLLPKIIPSGNNNKDIVKELKEYDEKVDNMTTEELLEGYVDFIG